MVQVSVLQTDLYLHNSFRWNWECHPCSESTIALSVRQLVSNAHTHSRTHSPHPHTLYQPLRGNLSSSTVSSSARSLFLLMNQLISNDFSTNFCDSRINIAEQCLWDWNFWQSAIPQRSRVQSVSTAHDWCADKTLSLKPKREGKQYYSLL